jgi:hypothetical protein
MTPKISIYNDRPWPHRLYWLQQFQLGLKQHGITAEIQSSTEYQPTDLAVLWSAYDTKVMVGQRRAGTDYLIMERGYVRRMEYASLGFNGLNGQADFMNADSPPDRWLKLGVEMKSWKMGGDYILLCGQIPNDSSLHGIQPQQEYIRLAEALIRMHRRPVYWRPHPQRVTRLQVPLETRAGPLDEALSGAWCIVTLSSNVAVDAALDGTPAITLDSRSMAYPVTRHDLMYSLIPWRPDRRQWAYNLAYAQWNADEIASGEAWVHLRKRYV